ncbi:hypothetical protein LTR78_000176 [Recurvomyces mirabilis]|uniref:Uncharacterized protein n=1 Tax=Recurvomyces mirabilis TaxID=574656 RepID=A0AAE0WWR1_9PEZI|nr:hypothetical protein LTR78_000176 [Recurvomyces mirabilis]KAK5161833.1 hypothetical protein LTS14_000178 [Recurvomyces mirabilis]
MEDIDSSPLSPHPRKRAATDEDKPLNLKGTQFVMPTPPDTEESSNASPNTNDKPREASPAPSISTMTSIEVEVVGSDQANAGGSAATQPPPAKRRKLTPAEKEAEAKAKAERKQEREEQKALKDEDRRQKDEEKRRKAEAREAKKREKDLEEQRKEEAKLKKDRSQLRLASFFGGKPSTPAKAGVSDEGTESGSGSARRKSLSLEPFDAVAAQIRRSASPVKGLQPTASKAATPTPTPAKAKPSVSDYDKYFLPYQLPNHSTLAATYDIPNPDDLAYWQGEFDREIKDPTFREKVDLGLIEATAVIDHLFDRDSKRKRGLPLLGMRAVVDRVQGTSQRPIDLTEETLSNQQPTDLLQTVTRRHLQFHEDVRPAYFGTYTKGLSPRSTRRLMVQPFAPLRKDTDYDYDSEAEWEEPEEGEDILGDEDDEAESLGDADEMDGFLDDEGDTSKRKLITGDLLPTCSGLCWENHSNVIVRSIESEDSELATTEGTPLGMKGMRLGVLLPHFTGGSIDPFSSVYWAHDMAPPGVPLAVTAPSRPPLQERNSNGSPLSQATLLGATQAGADGGITIGAAATPGAKRGPKAQPRTLSKEDFDEFKQAIVGNTVPKAELQKALKASFSKLTMEAIRDNLSTHFSFMGPKGSKKWYFVEATAVDPTAA